VDNVPDAIGSRLRAQKTACAAFKWVTSQFQGGENQEINELWSKRLQSEKMSLSEDFDAFVGTSASLSFNFVPTKASKSSDRDIFSDCKRLL
jgi:hypothetical protein